MSGLAEGKWFVPRTSRTVPPYRKGFAPVTREGYRCFGVFTIALVGSLLAGFAVPLLMPDDPAIGIGVGIVIIIAGVGGAMAWLFDKVRKHTDHTTTLDEVRSRRKAGSV